MLVLSRKQQESLWIGGDIVLTVLSIRGNTVRLGIEAPAETPVHRTEVFLAMSRQLGRPPPPSGAVTDKGPLDQ